MPDLGEELIEVTVGQTPDERSLFLGRLVHLLATQGVITPEDYIVAARGQ